MKIILGLLVSLVVSFGMAEGTQPSINIYIGLDATGSLDSPSKINPNYSQLEILKSLMPELYGVFRKWDSASQINLMTICHQPFLLLQTSAKRSAMSEVMRGIKSVASDCTQRGTRIDLTLAAIKQLQYKQEPYIVILLTDGISETDSGLNLEEAFSSLDSLKENPPLLFAMIGTNEEYVIPWLSNANKSFAETKTEIIIGSARDISSTIKRLSEAFDK